MKPFLKCSKGQVAVLMTLVIGVLLGAIALGTDVAVMYLNWAQIRKAADSAVLAGAGYYTNPNLTSPSSSAGCSYGSNAQTAACEYALQNGVKPGEIQSITQGTTPSGAQTLQMVVLRNSIPSFFSRLLPNTPNTFSASVVATAEGAAPVGTGKNLFPAGLPNSPNGQSFKTNTLLYLYQGVSAGNWEWLDIPNGMVGSSTLGSAPSGGGADNLASNIDNGCDCTLSVGNYVSPATGEKTGPVTQALAQIITNPGTMAPANPSGSQFVLVPIVNWASTQGASQEVQIQGFALMWLVDVCGANGSGQLGKSSACQNAPSGNGNGITLAAEFVNYYCPDNNCSASNDGSAQNFGALVKPTLIQ